MGNETEAAVVKQKKSKKWLAILLAVILVGGGTTAGIMLTRGGGGNITPMGPEVDVTDFETLKQAVESTVDARTINLKSDVDMKEQINVPEGVEVLIRDDGTARHAHCSVISSSLMHFSKCPRIPS